LNNCHSQRQQFENELTHLRSDLRDYKQRANELNGKVSDLQRQIHDSHIDKTRSEDKVKELEKVR
jgi:peptidoglycan hydrolase CwlO-like protein